MQYTHYSNFLTNYIDYLDLAQIRVVNQDYNIPTEFRILFKNSLGSTQLNIVYVICDYFLEFTAKPDGNSFKFDGLIKPSEESPVALFLTDLTVHGVRKHVHGVLQRVNHDKDLY